MKVQLLVLFCLSLATITMAAPRPFSSNDPMYHKATTFGVQLPVFATRQYLLKPTAAESSFGSDYYVAKSPSRGRSFSRTYRGRDSSDSDSDESK